MVLQSAWQAPLGSASIVFVKPCIFTGHLLTCAFLFCGGSMHMYFFHVKIIGYWARTTYDSPRLAELNSKWAILYMLSLNAP